MPTTRRRARQVALTVAAALTLAACAPVDPGGMGGGMGAGDMGGMGSEGMGTRSGAGNASDAQDETQAAEPIPGAREITVEAGDVYFEPDTIRTKAGEPVNITVTNVGDTFHDFTLPELDVRVDVPAGTSVTDVVAINEPGEYTYECTVPGHAAAGMTGTLIVESDGS